jgi:DHA1 family tetracycline resistance protein-like MFS transporter
MIEKKRSSFIAVFFTFFIDNLSWAIVFPIFAPYFLDPNNLIFSPQTTVETRTAILGLFLMAFSLGQFLGAPLIGEYADKHGRRKALIVSVFFTLIGLSLSAWSMHEKYLSLLFIGRLLTGIFASSNAVCMSCIADLSEEKKAKVKYFGYLSMIAGFAFLAGAFVGGKLADKTVSAAFFTSIPLWLAAFLTLINFIFVLFGFKETSFIHPQVKFHFWGAFRDIRIALQTAKIKRIYTVYFLFLFSWIILFQFFPVLTVQKYAYTSSNIGDLALFMGVCWMMGSGYLNRWLTHHFNSTIVLEVCLIGFMILCGLITLPIHLYGTLAILGLCVLLGGIAWPLCSATISNMAPKEMQGKILGMSQSVQSLAMAVGPVIGGIAYGVSLNLTFLIASFAGFIAVSIYYFMLKHPQS